MTTATPEITETTANVYDKTTCLLVRFHKTGLIRKGDMSKVETPADKKKMRLGKQILSSDSYDTMLTIARDCRRYIKKRDLPSPFKEGSHMIPVSLVTDIDQKVENARGGFELMADQFVSEYLERVEQAKADLKDQWDARNYYTKKDLSSLRAKFWVEFRWFDFAPASTTKVGDVIANREKQKSVAEVQDMAMQIKGALRTGLRKLISHLVERLTPKPDGSRKQFAPTTVNKVVEFLELFTARNVVGDNELALLANRATEILQGVDPRSLKDNDAAAAVVATQMGEVNTQLDALIQDMPERALQLDEDEDED